MIVLSLLLLLAAGCGGPTTTGPTETPTGSPTPTQTTTPTAEPTATGEPTAEPTEAGGTDEVTAYFVRETDSNIWVEPETHELTTPTVGVARAAMEELTSRNTIDPNLTTLVPEGTEVLGAAIDDGVLTVDFSEELTDVNLGSGFEEALAQQIAHTGAQFDNVDAVQVLVEGEPIESLAGHVDWSQPLEPDEFALVPIDIQDPLWGAEVEAGQVTLSGESNTFEATVELRLIAPDGEVAEETFTTATSGTGTRGTWEHTFTMDRPGRWTVEAVEPDPSGGAEGRPPFVTTLEVEVPA